ncbi:MAG: hypothetical protein J6M43_00070 [Neisseriaceae bacterium]|nr:hypothetical protein [Neisseriaceae bacterium]
MIDNPYAPPKSENFKLPKLTKGQKIRHILLGALSFSLLSTLLSGIFAVINLFFSGKEIQIYILCFVLIIPFLLSFIIGIIFSIYNERHIRKVKNRYIYSLISAIVILVIMNMILIFGTLFFVAKYSNFDFNLDYLFNALIHMYSKSKQWILDIETFIIIAISIFITIKILDRHRDYLYNQ